MLFLCSLHALVCLHPVSWDAVQESSPEPSVPYAVGPRTFEDVASRIDKSHDRKILIKSDHAQYLGPSHAATSLDTP